MEKTCNNPDCQKGNPQSESEFTRNENRCNDCIRRYHREYKKKWVKTEKGQASRRKTNQRKAEYRKTQAYEDNRAKIRERWLTDPDFRQKELARTKVWRNSPEGQAWIKNHHSTNKDYYKQYREAYYKSEAYNKATKKYQQSDKWKKMAQRRDAKRRAQWNNAEGSFTGDEWETLCARYDYKCLACRKKKPLTVDHIKPLDKGGSNYIDNIQPLCKSCNSSKGSREIDYRQTLPDWIKRERKTYHQLSLFKTKIF